MEPKNDHAPTFALFIDGEPVGVLADFTIPDVPPPDDELPRFNPNALEFGCTIYPTRRWLWRFRWALFWATVKDAISRHLPWKEDMTNET